MRQRLIVSIHAEAFDLSLAPSITDETFAREEPAKSSLPA